MISNEKPIRKQDILSKELGDEILLYRQDGKAIHVLNRTAHVIWELCDGHHTVQEMENVLRADFQLPDPQADIASDIERSLQMFATADLLQQNSNHAQSALTPKP